MRIASVCAITVGALCLLASPSAKAAVLGHGVAIAAASASSDTILVKKGGHGHGWGRGHGWGPPGFRGRHCPPGHWKKGWC